MPTFIGRRVAKVQPITLRWEQTSVEKGVMNKHENESAPLRGPNWFGSLIFCPGWLIHFQGDKKVKWHGWKWGDRGKGSLRRILNEMRDTEWNVNSSRRLAEWQSTYYSQRECLMRAERWHLRRTLDCDSFSPVFKAQLGYFAALAAPTDNCLTKTWTEMPRNPRRWHQQVVCPVLSGLCIDHCCVGETFRPV